MDHFLVRQAKIVITFDYSHILKCVSFQTLIAIKALGNIGVAKNIINPTLQLCIEDELLPTEVRIAAVQAYRYMKLFTYLYI
jgi:hypothetical protein